LARAVSASDLIVRFRNISDGAFELLLPVTLPSGSRSLDAGGTASDRAVKAPSSTGN
jgi:hypothetical protein